jgi:hypothetical protein
MTAFPACDGDACSRADSIQSVSVACTAPSTSRSAALSRCHCRRSYSAGGMPGGGRVSRDAMTAAAPTIARRSRLMKCRQPTTESISARAGAVPSAASMAHQAVTACRSSRQIPARNSADCSTATTPPACDPPGASTSSMPPSMPSSAESCHTIDS